ncbi:MAG TPA: substrate-binding domain-containing protein [Terriglobia bacterium]|nr:substrate-binding domain-containing protein [Terriglobia bacterium]
MKPQTRTLVFLTVLVTTAFLASCGKSYHQPDERYVLVASNIKLPYWQEAAAGLTDAARLLGVKAEVDGPDLYDPQGELKAFRQAVASHASGILVSPAQPDLFTSAIDDAIQKGIPVITIDSDAPNSHRILFIGTDSVRAGEESGKHMAELLHGAGNILIIAIPGQLNQQERLHGAEQALARFPKIKVIETFDDQGKPERANDEISKLLDQKKTINGILCLEASGGPGAAEVVHRLGLKGKIEIVAFDKNPETLDWISQGIIAGTIAQKPYTMSYYGLKFLDDLHHNAVHEFKNWRTSPVSPLPLIVDTGTAWVDAANVAAFKSALASHEQSAGSM